MNTLAHQYALKPGTLAHALDQERKAKIEAADWHANRHLAPLFPPSFSTPLRNQYHLDHQTHGRNVANQNLGQQANALEGFPHEMVSSHDAVRDFAKSRAQACFRIYGRCRDFDRAYTAMSDHVRRFAIEPPRLGRKVTLEGAVRRLCDEKWWRRHIRKTYGRKFERVARDIGLVQNRTGIYASDETVKRRLQQKAATHLLLEELTAVNQFGQEYTLADLQALSVSNPKNRRNELMVRMAGFEAEAKRLGDVAEFYTITCPSRMHRSLAASGTLNPKYDQTSPKEAKQYLQKQWEKTRAALHRRGIHVYGFRIAEPHHDGTPHWHLLLFLCPEHVARVRETLRHYALQVDSEEAGAQEHRFRVEAIDWSRGTATGYVAKYVSKNIDGYAIDCDLYGRDAKDSAFRIEAWASCWGIRQFQQIGGPSVTIWRELRRLSSVPAGAIGDAFASAHVGDWAGYCQAMGGVHAQRKDNPIQLLRMYSDKLNRYNEAIGDVIVGVISGDLRCTTRFYDWEIQPQVEKNASRQEPSPIPVHDANLAGLVIFSQQMDTWAAPRQETAHPVDSSKRDRCKITATLTAYGANLTQRREGEVLEWEEASRLPSNIVRRGKQIAVWNLYPLEFCQ